MVVRVSNLRGYCYRVVQFRGVLCLRTLSEDLFSTQVEDCGIGYSSRLDEGLRLDSA